MTWKVAAAKQQFSEVLRRAEDEPQIIKNRERVVGALIGGDEVEAYLAWRQSQRRPLAAMLARGQLIAAEENVTLEVPPRRDRPNALLSDHHVPARHKRRQ